MAFEYVPDKKIFLLNPVPDMSYSGKIEVMKPVIIDGNLERVC